MNNHRRRTMITACGPALLLLSVLAIGSLRPALADLNEALANAVAAAFTPAQMSQLITNSAGNAGVRSEQETRSLDRLRQVLGVNDDVALALLRNLNRPDILPAETAHAIAQSAMQYHTVTDRLTEIASDDPEGQHLVTQAQAAMIAGQFNDTEALLRQIEAREVAFAGRSPNGAAEFASSATQHLISAAQAGTILGEIALMTLRYGDATDYFQNAQKRLALLSRAEPDPPPAQPADMQAVPAPPPPPAPVVGSPESSGQTGSVQLAPQIDPNPPTASHEQVTAANGSPTMAAAPQRAPAAGGSASVAAVLSADMVTLLLQRGDTLLALGDVSSARLLFERAAAGGAGRGATGVGKTYDPLFLLTIGARGIQADPVAAATWYRRAIELGDNSAAERLTRISQKGDR